MEDYSIQCSDMEFSMICIFEEFFIEIIFNRRKRGVKYVNVFGVDNVLAKPADPFFIGFAENYGYDIACKYVPKVNN